MKRTSTTDEDIRLVPFTKHELKDVQLTILGKMMQLSHDVHHGKIPIDTASEELKSLGHVNEKVSRYCSAPEQEPSQPMLKK